MATGVEVTAPTSAKSNPIEAAARIAPSTTPYVSTIFYFRLAHNQLKNGSRGERRATVLVLVLSFINTSIVKGKKRAYLLFIISIISYITISRCF